VLLFDPFPAGLEPLYASRADLGAAATPLRYPWQTLAFRDDGLMLYAERLELGVYTYDYILRAAAPGRFAHRPATVEEIYRPEVFGRTAFTLFTVQGERHRF
ncbi:MAG: hypothetical protein LBB52_09200, partial [Desulfovibrio sp.]|jgi:uncharacterized protein YfaS (alpha-2-macroglobulin family)|nr:hypothetical protein [Desulfovibrio sp.]